MSIVEAFRNHLFIFIFTICLHWMTVAEKDMIFYISRKGSFTKGEHENGVI